MNTKRIILAVFFILFSTSVFILSCNKATDNTSVAAADPAVTALNCAGATSTGSFVSAMVYSGTVSVPYTGGNGAAYAAGTAISSTGVTGLTATLQAGTLASGAGTLAYEIKGTASSTGTASFAISFGGQSCSFSVSISSSTANCNANTPAEKVVCLANAFLATLSASQQTQVVLTLNLTNAKRWSNLPCGLSCRNGLLFSSLSSAQLTAALAVIQAASGTSSGEGYDEFNAVRKADSYLGQTAGGYSEGNYIIAFLGTPSATGKWMLQFGGHHYAQNIIYEAGQVVSITPLHEGVEPGTAFTYSGTTYANPLITEKTAMQEMLGSFSTTELASAKIAGTFSDCLLIPGSTNSTFPVTKQGIKVSSLSAAAQTKVLAAIAPWVNDLDSASAATYLAIFKNELADTYVGYASNTSGTSGNSSSFMTAHTDYARIDGPSVWIEFVCQNGVVLSGIHYHTVMRDHSRDYKGL